MGIFRNIAGGFRRDAKIKELKAEFSHRFPGQMTNGTLEGYCGMGMMIAMAINEGSDERLTLINAYEAAIEMEREVYRDIIQEAFDIGVDTVLKK